MAKNKFNILNARITFKNVPVHKITNYSFKDISTASESFKKISGVSECIIIQTASRVEIFLVSKSEYFAVEKIKEVWTSLTELEQIDIDHWDQTLEVYMNTDVYRNLLRLASGIESVVVGKEEILDEIKDVLLAEADKRIVFHAGELCDAMAFDDLTGLSYKLIPLFSEYPKARLELRTKTTTIENLLNIEPANNIVVSWTFSPQVIIDNHENKAPSLEERLCVAVDVQKAGYNVGICLDPIILCDGWFGHYKVMLEEIIERLNMKNVKFISLGGFRYLPSLSKVIRERDPQANLLLSEFVPCVDGKHRYFRPIRVEAYKEIGKVIRELTRDVKISLCMETPEVWNSVKDILK